MKNYYLKPLKCLLMWVLFLSITPIMAQEVPEYIKVSGIKDPNVANGLYRKAGTHGAFNHAYWKHINAEYYIYSDNCSFDGDLNYWNIDYDLDDEGLNTQPFIVCSYMSSSQDGSSDNEVFSTFVSPVMMSDWISYDSGSKITSITLQPVIAPTLTTNAAASITTVSASLGGNFNSGDVGDDVYERGIVYSSIDDTPTLYVNDVITDFNGSGTGSFSETITGLTPATTYYYQAFAYNTVDVIYGGIYHFTTEALPVISSVAVPINATYVAGQNLDFTVNFNKAITVDATGGTPFIPITLSTGGIVSAAYNSGSGTSALTFRYTVVAGNNDNDGITVGSAITANGGTLKDGSGNNATLTLISVGSTTGVIVEAIKPTATISLSDAALKAGETTTVTFTFSEAVTGFTNADIIVANGTLSAVSSGDGGITWSATFTPSASVTDATNVITLNVAGVYDAAGNAGIGTTNSPNYVIDTVNPSVTITSTTSANTNTTPIPVTVTFSESVIGFISTDITVTNGTVSDFAGNGTTYTLNVKPTAQGLVTVAIAGSVAQDLASNNTTAATSLTRTFDNVAPLISGVTNNGTYTSAQTPTFNEGTATLAKNGGTATLFTMGTTIDATGNYVLKVTDAAGNVTTASFAITITTGVDDQRETSLVIYPNPCTDGFNVSGIDAPTYVTITDLTGRVFVNTMVDVDGVVPVGNLKQGTYLVKVNNRVLKLIKN